MRVLLFVLDDVLSLESKILASFILSISLVQEQKYCNLRTFPEKKGTSRDSEYAQGELT